MYFRIILIIALLLSAVALSCSSSQNPISPSFDSGITPNAEYKSAERVTWGTWDIFIDSTNSAIEIVPVRGASFECNVVNFLQPPIAPIHLLTIQIDPGGTNFPEGEITCNVALKHPFPGTKFAGFDVLGIVMGDYDPINLTSDPDIITSIPPQTLLQNPDGYTRWWNQSEFTTYGTLLGYIEGAKAVPGWTSTHTLNPFKYFCDDLSSFDAFNPDPDHRGFFSSVDPGLNKRRYELQFPVDSGPIFHFKYAISASWVMPFDDTQPPYVPDDFPVTANMPEAYKIDMLNIASTAYHQNDSTYGGDLNLQIEIRDWQFNGDLSTISDEIYSVTLESPTLFPNPIELDTAFAIPVPGNPTGVRIPAFIEGVTPQAVENQLLIVTVKSANPTTYEPQIPGISGYEFPTGNLAAYNIIHVPISPYPPGVIPPVADASLSDPTDGPAPLDVNLDPSASYDPDGVIVLYEWDFESDGNYDISSNTPDIISHTFNAGIHNVTLRVTDDDTASDTDLLIINSSFGDSDWPSYRRFNDRTGYINVAGPSTDNVLWTWNNNNDDITCGIVLDHLERAVFVTEHGILCCLNPDGTEAWTYDLEYGNGNAYGTAAIGPDNSVYIGFTNSEFYKFDSDGNLVWQVSYSSGVIWGGCAVQNDGTILHTSNDGYLFKLDPDGNLLWQYIASDGIFGGPAIGPDGTIYVSAHGEKLIAIDQDGNEIWNAINGYGMMWATPALGDYGIYVGTNFGVMYCVSYSGDIIWQAPVGDIRNAAAIGDNGKLYVGTWEGALCCLDQVSGSIEWEYQCSDSISTCAPVCDGGGHVYIGDWDGIFYCLDADTGDLVWQHQNSSSEIWSLSPAIANDGTLYVGNNDGVLTAYRDQ